MREGRGPLRGRGRVRGRSSGAVAGALVLGLAAAGLAGAGWAVPAAAQEDPSTVRELTPEASVALALERSARVAAADADAAVARARAREAEAGYYPSVSGQASYMRLGGDIPSAEFTLPGLDTTFTLLPIERDQVHAELGLEQALFAGGRVRNTARSAARQAEAAERRAEQERADVALETRRAYWSLYGALAVRDATEAAMALVEEHLSAVRERYEAGALLLAEVLAARTRRSEVALELLEATNAVRIARLELNRLLGLPASTQVVPSAEPAPEALPGDAGSFAAAAAARQPRLLAQAAEAEALVARAAAVRGGWLPEVAAVGRYVYARPNPYAFTDPGSFRGTWEAGVALRWALWEGGAQGARVEAATAEARAAASRLEYARESATVEFARQYLEAERAAEAVAVAAEHVEQAAESLRVVRRQFEEGVALSTQVLDAEREYREAQARHARAVAEDAIARAVLRHGLGEV